MPVNGGGLTGGLTGPPAKKAENLPVNREGGSGTRTGWKKKKPRFSELANPGSISCGALRLGPLIVPEARELEGLSPNSWGSQVLEVPDSTRALPVR
jgi:hypothetical protein